MLKVFIFILFVFFTCFSVYSEDLKRNIIHFESLAYLSTINVMQNSNNAKGTIISKSNFGFNFKLEQDWSSNTKKKIRTRNSNKYRIKNIYNKSLFTHVLLEYRSEFYQIPDSRTSLEPDLSTIKYGFGIKKHLFDTSFYLAFDFIYGQELYFRAPSTSSIVFDRTIVYTYRAKTGLDLLSYYGFDVFTEFSYGIINLKDLILDAYRIEDNKFFKFSLGIKNKNLFFKFTYKDANKNTYYFKQKHNKILLNLGYLWSF